MDLKYFKTLFAKIELLFFYINAIFSDPSVLLLSCVVNLVVNIFTFIPDCNAPKYNFGILGSFFDWLIFFSLDLVGLLMGNIRNGSEQEI